MRIEIELVHADPGHRVVRASAIGAEGCLAMALGEGSSAEDAEERARTRLAAQLAAQSRTVAPSNNLPQANSPSQRNSPTLRNSSSDRNSSPERNSQGQPGATAQAEPGEADAEPLEPPAPEGQAMVQEPQADPEDWSGELASLDLQLQRLGWSREQESSYLTRAFGHGSRSRLTTYADLVAYLKALEAMPSGTLPDSASVPLKRSDLLSQCDQLLQQLGWDAGQGRQRLESHFGRSSRQQLSDSQLLEFNMLLEGELIDANNAAGPIKPA